MARRRSTRARWYRRPYDDELAGYLSTAQRPGWGLIAPLTATDFRVEDCVVVGESPRGSRAARGRRPRGNSRCACPNAAAADGGRMGPHPVDYQLRPRADRFLLGSCAAISARSR